MVIYRFPEEKREEKSKKSSEPAKAPDFIYIDEERDESEGGFKSNPSNVFQQKEQKKTYPSFLRVVTLILSAALTIWILLLCAIFAIVLLIAAISLFRSSPANALYAKIGGIICKLSAVALGLFLATLSPSFGFGVIALYAMQKGENLYSGPFGSIFKDQFNKFS